MNRITVNPEVLGGKPYLQGHRLGVEHVLSMLAAGDTPQGLMEAFPGLVYDDIRACLEYAWRLTMLHRTPPAELGEDE